MHSVIQLTDIMELRHLGHKHPLKFNQAPPSHASEEEEGRKEALCEEEEDDDEEALWEGFWELVEAPSEEEEALCKEEDDDDDDDDEALCEACWEPVEGPFYSCNHACKFYLHKRCAESELASEIINHPFHPQHPLTFREKSCYPNREFECNFCHGNFGGFVYCCAACSFDLDINCALLQPPPPKIEHSTHEHPLFFCEEHEEGFGYCAGCLGALTGPIFRCLDCQYFDLHKKCAELPFEIKNHPFHPSHPLILKINHRSQVHPPHLRILLPHSRGSVCNFCHTFCEAFVYNCKSCVFYLHVECALIQKHVTSKFKRLKHFGHEHQLIFLENHHEVKNSCSACEEPLQGSIYSCFDCRFHLHKRCAELPREIKHPFHSHHVLRFESKWANRPQATCSFCSKHSRGYVYHCLSCVFDLHIKCALLSPLKTEDALQIAHFSHTDHQLILAANHRSEVIGSCFGCEKALSGPIYSCAECKFHLHKKCAELPRDIVHHSHPKHPLFLCVKPPTHQVGCSCLYCNKHKGFVCYCSICMFGNPLGSLLEDTDKVTGSREIVAAIHNKHPLQLLLSPISFICNFCGTDGNYAPYVCTKCDLVVHRKCTSLPSTIKTTQHTHELSHRLFLQQGDKLTCKICQDEVNIKYGSYYCNKCNQYIAHVHCATEDHIWDKTANQMDVEDQRSKEALPLITPIIDETRNEGDAIPAKNIRHAFHKHILNLISTLEDGVEDNKSCDCCLRPLSPPLFSCGRCQFSLHQNCAELPRQKIHPLHRHPLILCKPNNTDLFRECRACLQSRQGFTYSCGKCDFHIDVECSLLSDTMKDESHTDHSLYLDHKYEGNCSCCGNHIPFRAGAYRCKHCVTFALDFKCINLPKKAWYKYAKDHLRLTCSDHSNYNQCYCDICEAERDPKDWFYSCECCYNTVHPHCVLGELPFVKIGSIYIHQFHPHHLTFVKNIWDCPRCSVCGELCTNQALECSKMGCNFIIHWRCRNLSLATVEKNNLDKTTQLADEELEDGMATVIEHPLHEHFLVLGEKVKDDKCCDGCIKPISPPFYGCGRCLFFLHKHCAELPTQMDHPSHEHPLTLEDQSILAVADDASICDVCLHPQHGFAYNCNKCKFQIDVRCCSFANKWRRPSHLHPLSLDLSFEGKCDACSADISYGYRCNSCKLVLDIKCATQPPTIVTSKHHKHLLILRYRAYSNPPHRCAICAKERHPLHWYYHCEYCKESFHPNCVLEELPYIKLGSAYKYVDHPHLLSFVEKIDINPSCGVCGELCKSQVLECKKSECKFIIHWECRARKMKSSEFP